MRKSWLQIEAAIVRSAGPRLWPALVVLALGLAFWVPAAGLTRGHFPIPLDDTYIYFDFARSTARGHLLAWVPGNGLSSGATSTLYALVLAVGHLLGFHGDALGIFAALVAVASIADASVSLGRLVDRPLRALAPLVVLSLPVLAFAFFSGMETSLFAAVLGRALLRAHESLTSLPGVRRRKQLAVGGYCAALVLVRPESVGLAVALALVVAHGAGSLSTLGSLLRAGVAPPIVLALQAMLFRLTTGEAAAAGAIRKLWIESPYLAPADMVVEWAKNVVRLLIEGLYVPFGGALGLVPLALLALASLRAPSRRIALAAMIGAASSFALVCLNATAPFQNYRYLAPVHLLLLVVALLGAGSIGGLSTRSPWRWCGIALLLWLGVATLVRLPVERTRFAAASKNIAEQQVEVGLRLRALDPPVRRVLVGDAGAIPYFSETGAIDGLGLGGFHDLPFARASIHGVPAVIELIERLRPGERPDVLAIYDAWWPGLGERFGVPLFSVRIEGNVICADPEKKVYRADWSLLEARDEAALDRLDVGDLIDERTHGYRMPSPHGGHAIDRVLRQNERPTYDAGRRIDTDRTETFTLTSAAGVAPGLLRVRVDDGPAARVRFTLRDPEGKGMQAEHVVPSTAGAWSYLDIELQGFSRTVEVEVRPLEGEWRSYAYSLLP